MRSLTYVEIDVDYCSLSYGVAPCVAAIPDTGDIKCFNTLSTCQDRENFANVPVTLRFAIDTDYLPSDIEIVSPSVVEVSLSPGVISLGENLGERATLSVTFKDHRHSDTGQGFDKYLSERGYDPFSRGTFWGKFRTRQPFLRGRKIRWITGLLGQSLAEMETRHYIIDSFTGPDMDGSYVLSAKDALKLADDERAQAPVINTGFLNASITISATSAALSPTGIGNLEYAASGYMNIGGEEIVSFTRSGDALTIARAQLGTTAIAHDNEDRCQQVLRYVAQSPAVIISDLLQTYAGIPSSYVPLTEWTAECLTYLNSVYSANIAEPTSVKDLVSELIEQAALAVWWSDVDEEIKLRVIRGVSTSRVDFSEENILSGSLKISEQPQKRISQVWTYYGQINPLLNLDDKRNFRSVETTVDLEAETDYGSSAITVIYSRWIAAFGRAVASRMNTIKLGRYKNPPRLMSFGLMRYNQADPVLAGGYRLSSRVIQDETGEISDAPVQVIRLRPSSTQFDVEAEEILYDVPPIDLTNRIVPIESNVNNINLRTIHDSIYPAPESGITVRGIVAIGVVVGSSSTSLNSFEVGDWPAGVVLTLEINGKIQGAGGKGGAAQALDPVTQGFPGGVALYTREDVDVEYGADGKVWGGAGGGVGSLSIYGPAAGGGGAGVVGGAGGNGTPAGNPGTESAGGAAGYNSGAGGGPGLPGGGASGYAEEDPQGGDPGSAIDGVSYVTVTSGTGDIRGPQVN